MARRCPYNNALTYHVTFPSSKQRVRDEVCVPKSGVRGQMTKQITKRAPTT
jgi:hypothetical protein